MNWHILLYSDDPGEGGVAQYNHTLLLALVEQGYPITVVQSQTATPLVQEQQRRGIHHLWLQFDTTQDFRRTVYDGSDAERIFRQAKPDLVLFSDSCPAANLLARHQAVRQGIPFLMVEGFVAPAITQHFRSPDMAQISLQLLHAQLQAAQEVIAVSQDNLNLLHQHYGLNPDQGRVIHNGRPESFFAPTDPATRQHLRQEIGVPETAVLCFTAARLEHIKGHQHLLDAIAQLRSTPIWPQLHFAWAGEGRLRPELEQQIAELGVGDRVHLLGQRWDIPDWFDAADLFILPSYVEGMPLSIMESMAKGVPVMASAVSGIPEQLGDTGLLLSPPNQDPEATVCELVAGITAWVSNSAERLEQGRRSHQRASAMFRQQRMVDETLEVVAQILENPKPGFTSEVITGVEAIAQTFQNYFLPTSDYLAETYQLQEHNLIAFPDWQQPDEVLFETLIELLHKVCYPPVCDRTTLLIYIGDLEAEVADMALSSVTLHLLSEENLPLDEGPALVLLTSIEDLEWRSLLSHLQGRVVLTHEDREAIAILGADSLPPLLA